MSKRIEINMFGSGGGLAGIIWWGFVVIKLCGHSFAAWGWWWIFLPIVPWAGLLVQHFNL
jgi:hypothetical protein